MSTDQVSGAIVAGLEPGIMRTGLKSGLIAADLEAEYASTGWVMRAGLHPEFLVCKS
jgi:hypothetical protein